MILHFETIHATSPRLEENKLDIIEFIRSNVQEIDQRVLKKILQNIKESGFATLVRNYQFKVVGIALMCKEKISKVSNQEILEILAIHKDFRNTGIGQSILEKLKAEQSNLQVRDYNLATAYFAKHGLEFTK